MDSKNLEALRKEMKKHGIDVYLVPMSDFHSSEYVGAHFKEIAFVSGFTGENSNLVVTQKEAALWADGRYFIQAAREIEGTGIELMKMGVDGVPTVEEYLKEALSAKKKGMVLGYDGRLISGRIHESYKKIADECKATIDMRYDLVDIIWKERPQLSCEKAWVLHKRYAGESIKSKLKRLYDKVEAAGADAHLVTSLYDIAWILNLRGSDIPNVPVFMSYLLMTKEGVTLYIQKKAVDGRVKAYLKRAEITVRDYDDIYKDIRKVKSKKILVDDEIVNARLIDLIPSRTQIVYDADPSRLMKSIKNKTEIENTREAHIFDGVAVTKFIYYVKSKIGHEELTELSVSDVLESLRRESVDYLDLSFDTISAYGPNAAMMHYSATEESFSKLEPHGFYLVDSGGHYMTGSTDITRTIALGKLTDEEKRAYTLTLRAHLRLMAAHFPEGATGQNLDVLSRGIMWDEALDYRCGTGHGVGHILNVHEGPNSFRWKQKDRDRVWPLEPGMITTDEPGLYEENKYGVRLENELLCVKGPKSEYGQFLEFENLTFAPYDPEAIIPEMLTQYEKATLNAYNKAVYEKIAPHLNDKEKAWLKTQTRTID